ncbi:hypothetical protein AMTR_s00060p00189310 [Amborella trichopoda]|uniref:Uncharacterized protein n=1 Tax=Amborella trichopoda TaxID=13333 RepID=W1NL02_AMBTC|nr:hypothetical protein AMTR_s00060p00189310 [Amborella trichopoda]
MLKQQLRDAQEKIEDVEDIPSMLSSYVVEASGDPSRALKVPLVWEPRPPPAPSPSQTPNSLTEYRGLLAGAVET